MPFWRWVFSTTSPQCRQYQDQGSRFQNFLLFFFCLLPQTSPKDSIIMMDNSPIQCHNYFEDIGANLSKSKSIYIKFIPLYSPFINRVDYSFHSIKSYVQGKAAKNQVECHKGCWHASRAWNRCNILTVGSGEDWLRGSGGSRVFNI